MDPELPLLKTLNGWMLRLNPRTREMKNGRIDVSALAEVNSAIRTSER
jgi:hypothetical protein